MPGGRRHRGRSHHRLTSIGVHADEITESWAQSGIEHASSVAALADSVYVGGGAHLCHEYLNGVETATPLWPWRMNARIAAATALAARPDHMHYVYQGDPPTLTLVNDPHDGPVDVTATIEAMFGPVPAECRR